MVYQRRPMRHDGLASEASSPAASYDRLDGELPLPSPFLLPRFGGGSCANGLLNDSEQCWCRLERTWDTMWHGGGTDAGRSSSRSSVLETTCPPNDINDDLRYYMCTNELRDSTSTSLLLRVRSWLQEKQDARRGVVYKKEGPCNLFEDWPIPPYPEDYDWDRH